MEGHEKTVQSSKRLLQNDQIATIKKSRLEEATNNGGSNSSNDYTHKEKGRRKISPLAYVGNLTSKSTNQRSDVTPAEQKEERTDSSREGSLEVLQEIQNANSSAYIIPPEATEDVTDSPSRAKIHHLQYLQEKENRNSISSSEDEEEIRSSAEEEIRSSASESALDSSDIEEESSQLEKENRISISSSEDEEEIRSSAEEEIRSSASESALDSSDIEEESSQWDPLSSEDNSDSLPQNDLIFQTFSNRPYSLMVNEVESLNFMSHNSHKTSQLNNQINGITQEDSLVALSLEEGRTFESPEINQFGSGEESKVTNTVPETTPVSSKRQCNTNNKSRKGSCENKQNTKGNIAETPKNDNNRLSVKQNTEPGNEYQRILQILLRHRGYQHHGFKLGAEVCGVGKLDDFVYIINENKYRFFQVKHSKESTKITRKELFNTRRPTKKENDDKKTNKSEPVKFQLVRYFRSFCRIKENDRFFNSEVEEITFLTNRKLATNEEIATTTEAFKEYLVPVKDFAGDKFLYFKDTDTMKYSLNIDAVSKYDEFMNYLHEIFKEECHEKLNLKDQFIQEYLEKVRVIVNYPDVYEIRKITFQEIFADYNFTSENSHLLENSLIHSEIEHLMTRGKCAEFLTNEDWKERIGEVIDFIKNTKLNGITNYETQKLLARYSGIEFENDSVKDMYEDIITFLNNDGKSILHCCDVQNEKLVAIKVLNILDQMKTDRRQNNNISQKTVTSYVSIHNLLDETFLVENFMSGAISVLVITSGNEEVDKECEEIGTKLVSGLKNSKQKIILISTSTNLFVSNIKFLCGEQYYKGKDYKHDFNSLNKKSMEMILGKTVLFQGKTTTVRALFNNDLNFANSVIDEELLLKITDKKTTFNILDKSTFESPGYNEQYYIPRELFQKCVHFDTVKENINSELFFITGNNRMGNEGLKTVLKENGIKDKDMQVLPKILRKYYHNGVVLNDLTDRSNEDVFSKIKTPKNTTLHWLHLTDTYLFHVDSRYKTGEDKCIPTMQLSCKEEVAFIIPHQTEKIFILVGDSGVGKSTVLTHIANKLSEKYTDTPVWIARINLRTFYKKKTLDSIGDPKNFDSTVNLIVQMFYEKDSSSTIARRIIEEGIKKSQENNFKMILLLDGFNEISKSFQNKTCSLIKTLNSECNVMQIWVTTQIQDKVKLESELEVPAYFLDSLSHVKQVNLMVNYWATKYSSNDTSKEYILEQLRGDAEEVLETWKNSTLDRNEKSFTEVSLNVIMLADVLVDNRKIDESIDLLTLYEMFVSKKFSIYNEETVGSKNSYCEIELLKEWSFQFSIKKILQEQSVLIILSKYPKTMKSINKLPHMTAVTQFKDFLNTLQKARNEISDYRTILSKIGLVSVKDEIDFIHDSFAQFFFSEYLINNLREDILKDFFVTYVLRERNFYLCRKFFNNKLQKQFKDTKKGEVNADVITSPLKSKTTKKQLLKGRIELSLLAEQKLDHIIKLLPTLLGKMDFKRYLEKWATQEFQFQTSENEDSVKMIVSCLKDVIVEKLPMKLRAIIMINKSDDENQNKVENILHILREN